MMDKTIVIYHKGCMDGISAAWCFWKKHGDSYEYYPGVYSEEAPDVTDKIVYLVDFSYKAHVIKDMLEKAKKVIILDHHKTMFEEIELVGEHPKLDMTHSTNSMSGAMISWKYNFPDISAPAIFNYIQDRDLWKFSFEETKAITAALFSYERLNIQNFDKLMQIPISDLLKEGNALVRKNNNDIERYIKVYSREMQIGGYTIMVCNVPGNYASEIGNKLAEESFSFAGTYSDDAKQRKFSLRSVGNFDVSEIAKKYGGGGHKNAAGFAVSRDHPLAMS